MPTLIDSLIVALNLDSSGYTEGHKKAREDLKKTGDEADKNRKTLEGSAKKSTEAFGALRKELLGLLTLFTAGVGLKQFVQETIESSAAVGRLAKNLDLSTETLSAWQGVLRRSGGTAQDAAGDLSNLVGAFQSIQLTGTSPLIPYLNLLKISLADLKDPSETLLKISDAFSKMDPAKAAAIGKGMGLSPSMISLLERGRLAVSQMLAEQRKIGGVSDADAKAAQQLQNTLSSLAQSASSVGRAILTSLAPGLDLMAKGLAAVAELAQRHKPVVIGLFLGIAAAATIASLPLLAVVGEMLALAAPFIAAGLAIGGVIEALIGLGHWFANLIRSNAQLRAAWDELKGAASDLGSAIGDAFAPLMPFFHGVADAVRGVWSAIQDAFGSASRALAGGFVNFLVNQFRAVADIVRAITALVHGDLKGAATAGRAALANAGRLASAPPAAAQAPASAPAGVSAPPAGDRAATALAILRSKGLTEAQAQGVVAGASAESRLDPNVINPKSGAFGIGQWLGARKRDLFKRYGANPSFAQQVEFLAYEINGGDRGGAAVRAESTATGAMQAYVQRLMRPAAGAETTGDLARGTKYLASLPVGSQAQIARAAPGPAAANDAGVRIDNLTVNANSYEEGRAAARGFQDELGQRKYVTQASGGLR